MGPISNEVDGHLGGLKCDSYRRESSFAVRRDDIEMVAESFSRARAILRRTIRSCGVPSHSNYGPTMRSASPNASACRIYNLRPSPNDSGDNMTR